MTTIEEIHGVSDGVVKGLLAKQGITPPCGHGCFWCCKESVIAADEEVREALELLSPEQRERVKAKTAAWLEKFKASGMAEEKEPPAHGPNGYRSLNLWCPLLADNGTCSVYARRPLACRLHIAFESVEPCKDDAKRPEGKFALFPELPTKLAAMRLERLKEGETVINDHLGVLLAKELLGEDFVTRARVECAAEGDAIVIKQYGEEELCEQEK